MNLKKSAFDEQVFNLKLILICLFDDVKSEILHKKPGVLTVLFNLLLRVSLKLKRLLRMKNLLLHHHLTY